MRIATLFLSALLMVGLAPGCVVLVDFLDELEKQSYPDEGNVERSRREAGDRRSGRGRGNVEQPAPVPSKVEQPRRETGDRRSGRGNVEQPQPAPQAPQPSQSVEERSRQRNAEQQRQNAERSGQGKRSRQGTVEQPAAEEVILPGRGNEDRSRRQTGGRSQEQPEAEAGDRSQGSRRR